MTKQVNNKTMILAPVGSFESLHAAIDAGADAVYFGIGSLNMRANSSKTFTVDDLDQIVQTCNRNEVKTYITLNTVIYDNETSEVSSLCQKIKDSGATGIIGSDFAVINKARELSIPITLSTQSNISNIEAVKFFASFADVMVLARELDLKQIQDICSKIKEENITGPSGNLIQIETFAHGALCVAISGKCYMSLSQYNQSANRGKCLQACRRKYLIKEEETGKELVVDNSYIMSPKDLCTIGIIDKLVSSGISILKIEGRGRSPEYVSTVIKAYKEAVYAVYDGSYKEAKVLKWKEALEKVYNRGFWEGGYYLGDHTESMAKCYGSKAVEKKQFIGKVSNYYPKSKIVECQLQAGKLNIGDEIYIMGSSTGVKRGVISSIENHQPDKKGYPLITFPFDEQIRRNDDVYLISKRDSICQSQ